MAVQPANIGPATNIQHSEFEYARQILSSLLYLGQTRSTRLCGMRCVRERAAATLCEGSTMSFFSLLSMLKTLDRPIQHYSR